ncbi:molybdopterin-dependent oxidoreductase [Mycobacterium sp.]|uniref:molybdopterin-dependent oxidoreductase n=1 Tax=Mycobacterium sp. TaxID=1785 RepID=UPI002632219E|nr:molybdopterin-dependent oxidoreductase [Mycobacterium sp.]
MADVTDPGENTASEAELQDEFLAEKLLSEQGVHPRMRFTRVHIRLGRRFFSVWWLLGIASALGIVVVAAAKLYAASGAGRGFLARHACIPVSGPVPAGMPAFVRWTHLLTFFFLVIIVRSGLQVLADHPRLYTRVDCTPGREWLRFRGPVPTDRVWTAKEDTITLSPLVGLPGGRHTIGVARHWHFLFDILFVLTGIVYAAFLFSTPWLHRLLPTHASLVPEAVSCAVTYASLHFPSGASGFFRYDALQQLTYFSVIFILAPLAILTGLAMSPALDNRFRWYARLFGNRQIARSIHFLVMVSFVAFFLGHMTLVALTGFAANLNDITLGDNQHNLNGFAIWLLVIALVIGFNVWAVRFSWTHTRVLQRVSNVTVGRVMDLLFDHYAPRVEYRHRDISPYLWPNHARMPDSPQWCALRDDDFRGYRLKVHGLVENPVELSLDQIKALPKQEQITLHHCIQGWSGIAEWGGLPFSELIELVRPTPEAQWVMFYSFAAGGSGGGRYYDSHSIRDLRHPQSLLAYEMNSQRLPILHGRPLRLRVENQLGFKHVKWISEIEFVHHFSERHAGQGGYNEDHEFFGYRDEI